LVHGFVWRMTNRRTKISPKSGRGLGHVTSTIFGSTVDYPSDSLASCYQVARKHIAEECVTITEGTSYDLRV